MNKYKRLGKNTFLVFIGNTGSKLIALVMLPFYTSWLSVEDYGVTDIINVYVSFLVSIVSCCIAESIFIFPKGQKVEKQKQYFSSGIVFVLQAFFVSFLLSLKSATIIQYTIKGRFMNR
jgi:O-antigen/teichoic acid export membrane protein